MFKFDWLQASYSLKLYKGTTSLIKFLKNFRIFPRTSVDPEDFRGRSEDVSTISLINFKLNLSVITIQELNEYGPLPYLDRVKANQRNEQNHLTHNKLNYLQSQPT